jgi:hypothetical protein
MLPGMDDLRAEATRQAFAPVHGKVTANALRELEQRANDLFAGQALTWQLRGDAVAYATAAMPPPDGYRWEVDRQEGDRLFLYVTRAQPGIPEGYRFAARVTIGFDGGNHDLRGDLWRCERCASLIFPGDHGEHTREHAEFDELRQAVLALAARTGPAA